MNLFLLRHEEAIDKSKAMLDAKRPLTALGKSRALKRAQKSSESFKSVKCLLTSPAIRCLDTAHIYKSVIGPSAKIIVNEALVTGSNALDVLRQIVNLKTTDDIIVVGHEPWLTELISLLMSGSTECKLKIKKGRFAHFVIKQLKPGMGKLLQLN